MSFNFEATRMKLPSEINLVRQQAQQGKLQNELLSRSMDAQVEGFDIENTLNKIKANIDQRNLDYFTQNNLSPAEQDSARIQAQQMQAEADVATAQIRLMEYEHGLIANGTIEDQRQYTLSRAALKDAFNQYELVKEQGAPEEEAMMLGQARMESFWPQLDKDWQANFDPLAGAAIVRSDTENTRAIKDWRETFGAAPSAGWRWVHSESEAMTLYSSGNKTEPFRQVKVVGGPQDVFTPTEAAKMAAISSGLTALGNVANIVVRRNNAGEIEIDRSVVFGMNSPLPLGKAREALGYMREVINARFRAETGAAANQDEYERTSLRLMPAILDDDFTIAAKFSVANQWLNYAKDYVQIETDPSRFQTRYDAAIVQLDTMLQDELRRRQANNEGPPVITGVEED